VKSFQATTVESEPERPMMVPAGSNPLGTTPARFEIVPSALSVIVGGEPGCLPALRSLPAPAQMTTSVVGPGGRSDKDGTVPDPDASGAKVAAVLTEKLVDDVAGDDVAPTPSPGVNG